MQLGLLWSLSLFCCAAGAGLFTTTRFSPRCWRHLSAVRWGGAVRGEAAHEVGQHQPGRHRHYTGGWLVLGMLGAARRCRFQTQRRVRQCSGGSGLVLGMLNVFHLPTTSAGGGSVSLFLEWLQARLPKRRLGGGGLGGLTCAILKLERSCLHHIRGLGARGRHAPLVGVHIILKDDSGGVDLVVVVLNVMIFNIPAHSGVARCGCRIASSRSTTSSNFRARGYLCCLRRCPSTPPDLVLQQKIHSGHCSCLLLLLCLMFELTIKAQTAQNHSGRAARRERRWQDRPLAASPRGYWCSVFSVLVSVSLC